MTLTCESEDLLGQPAWTPGQRKYLRTRLAAIEAAVRAEQAAEVERLRAIAFGWVAYMHGYASTNTDPSVPYPHRGDWMDCRWHPCKQAADIALAATPVASFTPHRDDCPGRFHVRDSAYCDLCNPGWRDTEWGRTYTGPCYPPTPVAPPQGPHPAWSALGGPCVCPEHRPAVAPAPNSAPNPPAPGERCASCGHELRWHSEGQCDCEGDGEAGLCPCPEMVA